MQKTLQQQAQEWLEDRKQITERRDQQIREGGMRLSYKQSAINPEALPEPLKTEVMSLLNPP